MRQRWPVVLMINSAYKWLPTQGDGYCNFFYWLLKNETHRQILKNTIWDNHKQLQNTPLPFTSPTQKKHTTFQPVYSSQGPLFLEHMEGGEHVDTHSMIHSNQLKVNATSPITCQTNTWLHWMSDHNTDKISILFLALFSFKETVVVITIITHIILPPCKVDPQ